VRGGARARRATLAAVAGLSAAAGCAPHRAPFPALPVEARPAAYRAALARREALGRAVDAQLTVWARAPRVGALPAMSATLALAGPDAFRLRVASTFGTAFDCGARGDSIVALVPALRLGTAADARRDTLGVRGPGALGFRVFAAAWRPPEEAWSTARDSGDRLTLRWHDAGGSLRLAIGPDGLPADVELDSGDSLAVRTRYRDWRDHDGVAWPALIEIESRDGGLAARCRVEGTHFREQPVAARLEVRLPHNIETLSWPAFRRTVEAAGAR
jgi:hypothetical protein